MKDNNSGITVAGGNGKGGESNQLNWPLLKAKFHKKDDENGIRTL